ncbi:uncharacterized protein LOC105697135 [Orussus abietinus]|uniref:uncharacterized protein LOC105697135 n=1 Tax=Orussus abietinus TaxID=222816 RepID=UPI000625D2E2|nr:uncharacterized protein LOC105697135 [Orussus abietinus]
MCFLALTFFGLLLATSVITCQAGTIGYTNSIPWTLVYTTYPIYDTETLSGVWNEGQPIDLLGNINPLTLNNQEKTWNSDNNVVHNETTELNSWNNINFSSNKARNVDTDHLPQNGQQVTTYRN